MNRHRTGEIIPHSRLIELKTGLLDPGNTIDAGAVVVTRGTHPTYGELVLIENLMHAESSVVVNL